MNTILGLCVGGAIGLGIIYLYYYIKYKKS
jgi:hypothetical protein